MYALTLSTVRLIVRGISYQSKRLVSRKVGRDQARLTEMLSDWTNRFTSEGITDAASSAECITAYVLGKKMLHSINTDEVHLNQDDISAINNLSQLRLKRMPVQYITGKCDFAGMTLKMEQPVFIPRPWTEELVRHCKDILKSQEDLWKSSHPIILEFGCGSGAISLALLNHFKELQVVCVDKLPEACALTKTNAERVGVEDRIHILNGDFTDHKDICGLGPFSFVVSNPPYVLSEEMKDLAPEKIGFESHIALNGGFDGLELVRSVLHQAASVMMPHGHLVMEVGHRHPSQVEEYVTKNRSLGLQFVKSMEDIDGRERFCHLQACDKC